VDQPSVSLHDGKGHSLADGVKYTLGSAWVPVPAAEQTFSAVADSTLASGAAARPWQPGGGGGGVLASSPFTPPQSPQVFTTFFLGSASFGYSLLPQVDAPETGRGRPPAAAAAARPLHAPLPQRSPSTPRPPRCRLRTRARRQGLTHSAHHVRRLCRPVQTVCGGGSGLAGGVDVGPAAGGGHRSNRAVRDRLDGRHMQAARHAGSAKAGDRPEQCG
jgi:hypothetical protein